MALPGLYLITDGSAAGGRLLDALEAAFRGGVRLVQLREKALSSRELLALASKAVALAHVYGARCLVNDRADIAALSGADGVHLTSTGYSPKEAREILGDGALIGASTHSLAEALRAEEHGADFVTFGPVFFTPSKAAMGEPVGTERLREAAGRLSIPVFGLGGIDEGKIKEVASTGAFVALISAIMSSADPEGAARRCLDIIGRAENKEKR